MQLSGRSSTLIKQLGLPYVRVYAHTHHSCSKSKTKQQEIVYVLKNNFSCVFVPDGR